jgi:hypothetical protein
MGEIEQLGALVKDLDIGLLDFMARYEGRDVCLCWKLGEDAIRYWHGAEEGFRGRGDRLSQFGEPFGEAVPGGPRIDSVPAGPIDWIK